MDALAPVWLVAKSILLLAGLLGPGAAMMRALRVPMTLATAFAGSAAALYTTVLVLQFMGLRISLGSLTSGLALITIVAAGSWWGRGAPSQAGLDGAGAPRPQLQASAPSWWIAIYAVFWLAVLWRAWHEPLAGPDIEFRWSFLAEQMLRHGSLDFYPPRSVADFQRYFWAESIPPGTSALHAWAYACGGGFRAAWTVPAVVLQLVALHELLWRLGRQLAGPRGAVWAVLAAVACPLLTWSILLGQETGLTALSVAGMAFTLLGWDAQRTAGWAALAGVFALLGAAAREYGLGFPAIGVASLVALRANRRSWAAFAAVAFVSLAWPLRTWVLTGNPFYSLEVTGVFPTNGRFIAWIEHDAGALGAVLHSPAGWFDVVRYFVLFAPAAMIGGAGLFVGLRTSRLRATWALLVIVMIAVLWAASVRYTNGGLFYSLRVLSPALAIAAVAAGVGFAALADRRPRAASLAGIFLAVLALIMLPATLALPQNPARTAWRDWPAFAVHSPPPDATLQVLLGRAARGAVIGVVLTDAPGYQRRFLGSGITVIPLWSSQADWLFDRSAAPADVARRWRESGVRHLVVTKWQTNIDFLNTRSRWSQPPFRLELVGETSEAAVFAITAVE